MSYEDQGQGQVLRVLGRIEGLIEGLTIKLNDHIVSESPRLDAMEENIRKLRERIAWATGAGTTIAILINYFVGQMP